MTRADRAEGAVQLALVVGLDQRLEAQVKRLPDQAGESRRGVQRGQQQDRVGARRPQLRQLPWIDHELLGQHRQGHRLADGPQIVQRAAEVPSLTEHRDGRCTARGVGTGLGRDVEARRREPAGRR